MLIVGAVAGYFISENSQKSTEFAPIVSNAKSITAKRVPKDFANSLIKAYVTQNDNQQTGLRIKGGGLLKGFFIDKSSIDSIYKEFAANPDFAGLSLYMAKNPEHMDVSDRSNIFTLIVSGAATNKASKDPVYTNGETYEYVDTCPVHCGDTGSK
jgi:hypothetical protein